MVGDSKTLNTMKRNMKRFYLLLSILALLTSSTLVAQTASTVATTENYRAAQSVARDLKSKKYDKAAGTVLSNREVKRRTKMNDREIALAKDPRGAASQVKKDPVSFAQKHKSSFWDRFRKNKKTKPSKK